MLRKIIVFLALPLLAACGGEDFTLKVDRSAAIVGQELAKIDPNVLVTASGLSLVKKESDDGTLRFTMPSTKGKGELVFEVVETGPQSSEVRVTLDIPMVTRDTGDPDTYEYLSEPDIEEALNEALREWEREVEATRSTDAALAEVSELVSTLAIGLQDFEQYETLAGSALFQRHASDFGSASTETEWAANSDDWGSDNGGWAEDEPSSESLAYDDAEDDGGWGEDAY